eukprot:3965886-Prymnesium_polylepis.1
MEEGSLLQHPRGGVIPRAGRQRRNECTEVCGRRTAVEEKGQRARGHGPQIGAGSEAGRSELGEEGGRRRRPRSPGGAESGREEERGGEEEMSASRREEERRRRHVRSPCRGGRKPAHEAP